MELVYLLLIWFFAKWRVLENSEKSVVFKIFLGTVQWKCVGGYQIHILPGWKTYTPLNSGEKTYTPSRESGTPQHISIERSLTT